MNRRTLLAMTGNSAVVAIVGAASPAATARLADPFVPRFERFRADLAVFNAEPDDWPADVPEPWNTLCRELDTGELAIGSAAGAVMAMQRIKDLDCIIDGEAESYLDAVMAFLKARA